MKHFVVYNEAGKILSSGTCPNKDVELQAKGNEKVLVTPERIKKADIDFKVVNKQIKNIKEN